MFNLFWRPRYSKLQNKLFNMDPSSDCFLFINAKFEHDTITERALKIGSAPLYQSYCTTLFFFSADVGRSLNSFLLFLSKEEIDFQMWNISGKKKKAWTTKPWL